MKIIPKQREFYQEDIDDDFYSKTSIIDELEDDEISAFEQCFMHGSLNG